MPRMPNSIVTTPPSNVKKSIVKGQESKKDITHLTMPNPILTIMTRIRASVLFTQDTSSAKTVRLGSEKHNTRMEQGEGNFHDRAKINSYSIISFKFKLPWFYDVRSIGAKHHFRGLGVSWTL